MDNEIQNRDHFRYLQIRNFINKKNNKELQAPKQYFAGIF